jgi:hypothetical protein
VLKYYVLLFIVLGVALFYVFVRDPCNQQVRDDFAARYPGYEILDSSPAEGSPERVRCQISYRKPEDEQIYRDTWLYLYAKDGWSFAKILEAGEKRLTR